MDSEALFRIAIDRIYETFAGYAKPEKLDMSPLRDPKDFGALLTAPLRSLGVEAICTYANAAMTTVGEVSDYKYFLPRIMELATLSGLIEPETIALKLDYADWQRWPTEEKEAIVHLFESSFEQVLGEHPDNLDAASWFCAIALLGVDIRRAIEVWQRSRAPSAPLHLSNLLQSLVFEVDREEMGLWSSVNDECLKAIRNWLLGPDVQDRLLSARHVVCSNDAWMLDQALNVREEKLRLRRQ